MAFRFRKKIRIAPGLDLNVGRKGVTSASIGKKGASINISKRGMKQTIGIPGTGLSYQTDKSTSKKLFILIFVAILAILIARYFIANY